MQITLTNTGKRFNREWIFRHCNYVFKQGERYAITGPNGSGKSTLLQVIGGALLQSEGGVEYLMLDTGKLTTEDAYKNISIVAPYLELIEEMTAVEFLQFHRTFKKLSLTDSDILKEAGLAQSAHKQLRYYSSGMKQRLKLAQAFFSDTSVLLLDEPTTNLDAEGIQLYKSLIQRYTSNRLVIVSSNDVQEYDFCKEVIAVQGYRMPDTG